MRSLSYQVRPIEKAGINPALSIVYGGRKDYLAKIVVTKGIFDTLLSRNQKSTLRVSNPLPKLYTRLLNREVRKRFLESRTFTAPNRTLGVRIHSLLPFHFANPRFSAF